MQHGGHDDFMELRVSDRVRDLGGNDRINEFGSSRFIVGSKREEEVCMREAAFLEFDDMHMCDRLAEDTFSRMSEVFEE
jgi:hypothetical protein